MAASVKSKPTASAAGDLASLRNRKAELLAGQRSATQEGADLRAGASALALQPEAHHAQFVRAAAADERAKLIGEMIAELEPQIAEAEKAAAREALVDERAELVREGDALSEEWREIEPLLDRLAGLFERIRKHDHSLGSLNSRLSEAGRVRTRREDGATLSSTAPGFERIDGVRPEGWADASVFIEQTHIPSLRNSAAPVWAGRRVQR